MYAKLTDKNLIKRLMKDYGYSREETIKGYSAFTCYNSDVVIDGATVVEVIGDLNDEHDYGFENGDFSACRQAEKDGVKFINDIDGLEKGCYVDTPENREICIKGLQEHPEYRIENWLFNETCSEEYRNAYIETFGNPKKTA